MELSTDHFAGVACGLIFTVKVFDLLEAAGFEHAVDILAGLLTAIVNPLE